MVFDSTYFLKKLEENGVVQATEMFGIYERFIDHASCQPGGCDMLKLAEVFRALGFSGQDADIFLDLETDYLRDIGVLEDEKAGVGQEFVNRVRALGATSLSDWKKKDYASYRLAGREGFRDSLAAHLAIPNLRDGEKRRPDAQTRLEIRQHLAALGIASTSPKSDRKKVEIWVGSACFYRDPLADIAPDLLLSLRQIGLAVGVSSSVVGRWLLPNPSPKVRDEKSLPFLAFAEEKFVKGSDLLAFLENRKRWAGAAAFAKWGSDINFPFFHSGTLHQNGLVPESGITKKFENRLKRNVFNQIQPVGWTILAGSPATRVYALSAVEGLAKIVSKIKG